MLSKILLPPDKSSMESEKIRHKESLHQDGIKPPGTQDEQGKHVDNVWNGKLKLGDFRVTSDKDELPAGTILSPGAWKEIIPEEKEEGSQRQPLHIIGASAIGPFHVINGIPCQDACAFETLSSGFGIIALADGLGSASKSEIGATIAVGMSVNKVKEIIINK